MKIIEIYNFQLEQKGAQLSINNISKGIQQSFSFKKFKTIRIAINFINKSTE